jgi:hypothetical protein
MQTLAGPRQPRQRALYPCLHSTARPPALHGRRTSVGACQPQGSAGCSGVPAESRRANRDKASPAPSLAQGSGCSARATAQVSLGLSRPRHLQPPKQYIYALSSERALPPSLCTSKLPPGIRRAARDAARQRAPACGAARHVRGGKRREPRRERKILGCQHEEAAPGLPASERESGPGQTCGKCTPALRPCIMQRALRRAPPAPSSQAASGFAEHRLAGPGQACSAGRRKGPEQPGQLPPPDLRWADLLRAAHPRLRASRQLCSPARQPPAPSGLLRAGGRDQPCLKRARHAAGSAEQENSLKTWQTRPTHTRHLGPATAMRRKENGD